uniref:UPAR/Ly6 domain-containing protein n=1 Tax=Knipowitschia caucasica TaxID=637954 RepID=A0AAV2JCX1_KNICA
MIMKTFVLILVLLCVFIHTAEGLQCRRCYGYSSCDQTPQICSGSQTFCFSRATTDYIGYERYTYHYVEKGCASHDMCTSTGSHVVSHDIGYRAHVTNTTCCDTDNCNDAVADYSMPSPPAGPLQCYGCDPSRHECIANVTCRDHESCFQSFPSPYSSHWLYYGCISENVCSNSSLSTLVGHVSCCNTSHCNVPELGIQCQTCVNYDCSSQRSVFCSNDVTMCHSQYRSDTYPDGTYTHLEKGCASSEKCPSTGSHLSSHNIGSGSSLIYTSCCDTDNCNNNDTACVHPVLSLTELGIQCQTCVNYDCSSQRSVFCSNDVTMCHSQYRSDTYPDGTYTHLEKGCASSEKCPSTGSHLSSHNIGSGSSLTYTSCCDTDNCNNNDTDELGIQCQTCVNYDCSSQRSVFCSNDVTMCHSQYRSDTYPDGTYTHLEKGCASSEKCPSTGSHLSSHNIGSGSSLTYTSCCDTDNCNNNDTDVPPLGSLQCYGCDIHEDHCTANVTCREHETCFKSSTHYNNELHFGCISENVCSNSSLSTTLYGLNNVSCCDTPHCNVPGLFFVLCNLSTSLNAGVPGLV